MKDFEKKINKIDIPIIENEALGKSLKKEIENNYFGEIADYRRKFRYAVTGFASLILILIGFVLNPDLPQKVNHFVFDSEAADNIDTSVEKTTVPRVDYTSITNPSLNGKINPLDFKEDTAYIIRKYNSDKEGAVLIVSEFEEGFSQKQKLSHTM